MNLPAFHIHLHDKIQRGQAAIGKLDGKHPILACATTAGKVFLHEPHNHNIGDNQTSYLNINKQLTALTVGKLTQDGEKDVLLLGSLSNLQCYDVEKNQDLFFKDVQDGVQSLIVGPYLQNDTPLVIVGGNCSLQGFGADGTEHFWTVAGDVVTALAFCDVDQDGKRELLVGSDDFDLRVFKSDMVVSQISEADQFVGLATLQGPRFGYALSNGTVGVYEKLSRVWRVKSKHSACTVTTMDFDGDGVPELISGWDNGRVEVRRSGTGEVVCRDHLSCSVSSLLCADYRNDGKDQLIACGFEGEVRGYLPIDQAALQDMAVRRQSSTLAVTAVTAADLTDLQQQLADLAQRKQELLYELTSYQAFKASEMKQTPASAMVIPGDTRVDSCIAINRMTSSCDLILSTSNGTLIRGAIIFGEQIFPEESLFMLPKVPDSSLLVSLQPLKDISVVLMMKVLVGHRSYSNFHVFELEIELPKFAMYAHLERAALHQPEPTSSVTFQVRERTSRISVWLEARFNVKTGKWGRSGGGASGHLQSSPTALESLNKVFTPSPTLADVIECCFLSLRSKEILIIQLKAQGAVLQVTFRCQDMDLCGELVQDLTAFLGVVDLNSLADFPKVMEDFKKVLSTVDAQNLTRLKMGADMADCGNLVKLLMVKAEDARVMGDMRALKRCYRRLYDLNRDLIAEHEKRQVNHASLLQALKEVNQMIQRASRLRVGASKTKLITAARAAVKENNMAALFKIFKEGTGPMAPGVSESASA